MPVLEPGEQIILSGSASYEEKYGALTLTTRRLVFESQSGIISKKTYTNLDVPLNEIANVTTEGLLGKKLCVAFRHRHTGSSSLPIPLRCEFKVGNLMEWQQKISQAIIS